MSYLLEKFFSTLISKTNSSPLDSYTVANDDSAGATKYYGFLRDIGEEEHWYIMRITVDAGVNTYMYAVGKGVGSYSTAVTGAWAKRADLDYRLSNLVDFR